MGTASFAGSRLSDAPEGPVVDRLAPPQFFLRAPPQSPSRLERPFVRPAAVPVALLVFALDENVAPHSVRPPARSSAPRDAVVGAVGVVSTMLLDAFETRLTSAVLAQGLSVGDARPHECPNHRRNGKRHSSGHKPASRDADGHPAQRIRADPKAPLLTPLAL